MKTFMILLATLALFQSCGRDETKDAPASSATTTSKPVLVGTWIGECRSLDLKSDQKSHRRTRLIVTASEITVEASGFLDRTCDDKPNSILKSTHSYKLGEKVKEGLYKVDYELLHSDVEGSVKGNKCHSVISLQEGKVYLGDHATGDCKTPETRHKGVLTDAHAKS